MSFRPCSMNLCKEEGSIKFVEPAIVKWRGDTTNVTFTLKAEAPATGSPGYTFPGGNPFSLGGCSVTGGFVIATLSFEQARADDWYSHFHACHISGHRAVLAMQMSDGSTKFLNVDLTCTFEATAYIRLAIHHVVDTLRRLFHFFTFSRFKKVAPPLPMTSAGMSSPGKQANGASFKREPSANSPGETGPSPPP
jgi:hypothetical protein